jgi:hypothetical protein
LDRAHGRHAVRIRPKAERFTSGLGLRPLSFPISAKVKALTGRTGSRCVLAPHSGDEKKIIRTEKLGESSLGKPMQLGLKSEEIMGDIDDIEN